MTKVLTILFPLLLFSCSDPEPKAEKDIDEIITTEKGVHQKDTEKEQDFQNLRNAMQWEDLKEKFLMRELPFNIDWEKNPGEESVIDSSSVLKYFILNDEAHYTAIKRKKHTSRYLSRYLYEKDNYIALVVWHEYSPTGSQDYFKYTEVFTFTKQGIPIDGEQLGCQSYNPDLKANKLYVINAEVNFMENGSILVSNDHAESTLNEKLLKPGEKAYYKSEKTSEVFQIDGDGHISFLSIE